MIVELTLDCLRPGMQAVVIRLDLADPLRQRLRDFGMVPGTLVRCRCRSAGGGLLALELRGTVLAMRRWDLRRIVGKRVS